MIMQVTAISNDASGTPPDAVGDSADDLAIGSSGVEIIDVVAAVLERRGRLLLAQRPLHKAHGGQWEFPGGKVDGNESHAAALARELQEELALTPVTVGAPLGQQRDLRSGIVLHFLQAQTDSAPIALEHMALGWYRPEEALGLNLAPLDRAFLESCADQVLSAL